MVSVNCKPLNLQWISRKPWNSSLLSTNKRNGRVTHLGIFFLQLQMVMAWMIIKCTSSHKLHNILLTNQISSLWKYISGTTSQIIFACFETPETPGFHSQRDHRLVINKRTNNPAVMRPPFTPCNWMPDRRCLSIKSRILTLQNNTQHREIHPESKSIIAPIDFLTNNEKNDNTSLRMRLRITTQGDKVTVSFSAPKR